MHAGYHHPTTLPSHEAARVDIPNAHLEHPDPHWCTGNCRTDPYFLQDNKPVAHVVCSSPISLSSGFVKLYFPRYLFQLQRIINFLGWTKIVGLRLPGQVPTFSSRCSAISSHLVIIGVDPSSRYIYSLRSLFDCSMIAFFIFKWSEDDRNPTLGSLLRDVRQAWSFISYLVISVKVDTFFCKNSHKIHDCYFELHYESRQYQRWLEKQNLKRRRKGMAPIIGIKVEAENFQDPQVSSSQTMYYNVINFILQISSHRPLVWFSRLLGSNYHVDISWF